MDSIPPGSSVHGILWARILESVPIPFFRRLLNPGIETTSLVSPALAGRFFTTSITWEAHLNRQSSKHTRSVFLICQQSDVVWEAFFRPITTLSIAWEHCGCQGRKRDRDGGGRITHNCIGLDWQMPLVPLITSHYPELILTLWTCGKHKGVRRTLDESQLCMLCSCLPTASNGLIRCPDNWLWGSLVGETSSGLLLCTADSIALQGDSRGDCQA